MQQNTQQLTVGELSTLLKHFNVDNPAAELVLKDSGDYEIKIPTYELDKSVNPPTVKRVLNEDGSVSFDTWIFNAGLIPEAVSKFNEAIVTADKMRVAAEQGLADALRLGTMMGSAAAAKVAKLPE